MNFVFTLKSLLSLLGEVVVKGHTETAIKGIASLDQAGSGDLSFLINSKSKKKVPASKASAILLPKGYEGTPADDQAYLYVSNPGDAFINLCQHIERQYFPSPEPGIHPSAVIAPSAQIASDASIGPLSVIEDGAVIGSGSQLDAHVFVGKNVEIGSNSRLMPRSVIMAYCKLGNRVRLHPGVVIGGDGFGYTNSPEGHKKEPQIGTIIIEDDVEIGANSTVDRARFSETRIGQGSKIDNLVQVGHNVSIGRHCILCAQVGVGGSTVIEDWVMIGGQAGFSGHICVAKGSQITGQTGVTKDIPQGFPPIGGNPAIPMKEKNRIFLLQRRLPELFNRVTNIEELLQTESSTPIK